MLPATIIRLAAGRQTLDEFKQAMCFMAGANAVFTGEQMLTTPCTYLDVPRLRDDITLRPIMSSILFQSDPLTDMYLRFAVGRRQDNDGALGPRRHEKL